MSRRLVLNNPIAKALTASKAAPRNALSVIPRVDRSAVAPKGVASPVIRTVASENKGVDAPAETIAKFRTHFESSGERTKTHRALAQSPAGTS